MKLFRRVLKIASISIDKFIFITLLLSSISFLDVAAIALVPLIIFSFNDSNALPDFMIDNSLFDFENLLVYLLIVFLIKFIFIILTQKFIINLINRKHRDITVSLLEKYHNYNYLDFSKKDPNELVNILINAVPIFINKALYPFLRLFADIIILFVIIATIFFIDFYIPLAILGVFSLLGAVFFVTTGSLTEKYGNKLLRALASMFEFSRKSIEGYEEIKASNANSFFTKKFEDHATDYQHASARHNILLIIPKQLMETGFIFIFVSGMFLAQIFGIGFEKIIPVAGAVAVASIRMLPIIINLLNYLNNIKYSIPSIESIEKELEIKSEKLSHIYLDKFSHIKVENLCFGYEGDSLFKNLNFELKKGEVVGICGPSGAGKSTLLRIILGFIEPDSGKISIDGKLRRKNLILKSSLLSQKNFIINGSVSENIKFGDNLNDNKKDRITTALKMSGLYDFIQNNDDKENLIVGDKGATLSGGQQQRLALARIFYSTESLVVFDEPTSSLDEKNSKLVIDSLKEFKKDRIVIVVTHDIELTRKCDKVITV